MWNLRIERDKLTETGLISAFFVIALLIGYLVFQIREKRKKPCERLLNDKNKILPCRQCQLIAMGEMASLNGFCSSCEKIPPPLMLFGIV